MTSRLTLTNSLTYMAKRKLFLAAKLKQRLKRIRKAYDDQSDVSVRPEFIEQYRKKS